MKTSLEGKWTWRHDGANKNGDIILQKNGNLSHDCGWSGGFWKMLDGNMIYMEFNGVKHTMCISEDKQTLVLIQPLRQPITTATFSEALREEG